MIQHETMNKKLLKVSFLVIGILLFGYFYFTSLKPVFNFPSNSSKAQEKPYIAVVPDVQAKFDYLSKNGDSSCSDSFKESIKSMEDSERLKGSCCSPMSLHRYSEQIEGLKKYVSTTEIPTDPYDIEAASAKKFMGYYDMQLTPEEQKAYDYAMQNSDEKGPCCCKCWRWYVYGGLGKYLIREKGFTGEQITEIWNLSDGCGGEEDHVEHNT